MQENSINPYLVQVVALARKLGKLQPLQLEFKQLINSNKTQQPTLTHRVPTRWNSDFTALKSHVMFKKEVLQLITANPALKKYALTATQWTVAQYLAEVLVVGPVHFRHPKYAYHPISDLR